MQPCHWVKSMCTSPFLIVNFPFLFTIVHLQSPFNQCTMGSATSAFGLKPSCCHFVMVLVQNKADFKNQVLFQSQYNSGTNKAGMGTIIYSDQKQTLVLGEP